jgi:enoyl-CoA hydratase
MGELVQLAIDLGVARIRLNDPETRNSLAAGMSRELVAACDAIDSADDVGVAIISGASGYFCSGANRSELADIAARPYDEESRAALTRIYEAFGRVSRLRVPSIAAVRGGAVGAGLNLVLACDVRVIADDAKLIGFNQLGVHPGGGHLSLLAQAGGRQTAVAVAAFGEVLTGSDAARLGLAWASPADGEVDSLAGRLAARAAQDPALTRSIRRSLELELGPPQVSWAVATELERSEQLRSFERRAESLSAATTSCG